MKLTSDQADALTEVINIGVGKAAASLSELIGMRLQLTIPSVQLCKLEDLNKIYGQAGSDTSLSVTQSFDGQFSGRALLVFPESSAITLSNLLGGSNEKSREIDVEVRGIMMEVGNILLNGVLGSLSNMIDSDLSYSLPQLNKTYDFLSKVLKDSGTENEVHEEILIADATFNVAERSISGSLMIIFDLGSMESLLKSLLQAQSPT